MIEVKLTTEQKVDVNLTATRTDASGNTVDAKIEGDIIWEVTQGDATVDQTNDGATNAHPWIVSGSEAVESKILAKGDADLGEGVTEIVQEFSVIVSFPQATGFNAVVGTPVAK